jgi:hypothetical protein
MTEAIGQGTPGEVWTYDDFSLGKILRQISVVLDEERVSAWESIFGALPPDRDLPRGLTVSALVEGFIQSGQPRPQGNIHARQALTFTGRTARRGDKIDVTAAVLSKEIKRDRKWITFKLDGHIGGDLLCSGEFTVIWAV